MRKKEAVKYYVLPTPTVGDHTQVPDRRDHNIYPEVIYTNNVPLELGMFGSKSGEEFLVTASLFPTTAEDDPVATNILIWPVKKDSFTEISDLSDQDLRYFAQYSLALLQTVPGSVVTYGISSDERGITGTTRKALGSSARNFHAQCYIGIEQSLQIPDSKKVYRSIREPFSQFLETIFIKFIQTQVGSEGSFKLLSNEEKNKFIAPYHNYGGVVLEIDAVSTANKKTTDHLAAAIKQIHVFCESFHDTCMGTFFLNYDDVRQSEWRTHLVGHSNMMQRENISNNFYFLSKAEQSLLCKFGKRISRSDSESLSAELKIFRSPTYSVGIILRNDKLYIAVNPHFYSQRAGGLQALGVEVPERIRLKESPYTVVKKRTARARKVHKDILLRLNQMSDGSIFS